MMPGALRLLPGPLGPGPHAATSAGTRRRAAVAPARQPLRARCTALQSLRDGLASYPRWPPTAKVSLRTGVYISTLGCALAVWPRAVFGLAFAGSPVPVGWIRVGATLAALFGFYYVGAALDDSEGRQPRHMYTATVWGRLALSASFCLLVAARQAPPGLLLLALANAASALVLLRALVH